MDLFEFAPEDELPKTRAACLFVHPGDDTLIAGGEMASMYAKARGTKKLVKLPGVKHHEIYGEGSFRIPAIYLNDWPDRYIHTNFDTPANIDPTKLRRAGFIAAAARTESDDNQCCRRYTFDSSCAHHDRDPVALRQSSWRRAQTTPCRRTGEVAVPASYVTFGTLNDAPIHLHLGRKLDPRV